MTYFEVDILLKQYFSNYKNGWEQTRFISYIQASCNSTKPLKPTDIIKFGWDIEEENISTEDLEARKKEMLEFVKSKYENDNNNEAGI